MSGDFTIEGRMKQLPDIQRSWMWQLVFTPNSSLLNQILGLSPVNLRTAVFNRFVLGDDGVEALTLRCKSVSIPQRTTEVISSDWMGTTQYTQGRPRFGNTLSVEFEETEDQVITEFLYNWQQLIFDITPALGLGSVGTDLATGLQGGSSRQIQLLGSRRRALSTTLYLDMYRYDGVKMKKRIKIINAWPQSVGDSSLSYGQNDSVKYNVTFQFDYWKLDNISLRERE